MQNTLSNVSTGFIRIVVVAALAAMMALPQGSAFAQAGAAERTAVAQAFPARDYRAMEAEGRAAHSPSASRNRRIFGRTAIGALVGGATGGLIGHYAADGLTSCPTSPNYPCRKPRIDTASGALFGAAIGGAVGLVTGWRR